MVGVEPSSTIRCDTALCHQYLAGDGRVNEQAGLITMHTLWAREHNRIALSDALQNKDCSSDTIFNTARHIVTSQIQKIMYEDYLPLILGRPFYNKMGFNDYNGYNKYVKPNIANAFASAAYRFGHSQVQPEFKRFDKNLVEMPPLELVDMFFNTSKYRETGTDAILRGLMNQPARKLDEFISSRLTNELFANETGRSGMDLASLNLMRGRDHGIPPYFTWKQWAERACREKSNFRNDVTVDLFFEVYGNLNTVDLFVGGLAEDSLPGGLVGSTFACIIANTLLALRDGDRFFYKNTDIFTNQQIQQIEKVNLANVICENVEEDFGEVNINPFIYNGSTINCDVLRQSSLDLDAWDCRKFTPKYTEKKQEEKSILTVLKDIIEQLEAQEVHTPVGNGKMDTTKGESGLSDEELADKLESLLNKVKKK